MVKRLQKISKYRPSIFQGSFAFSRSGDLSLSHEHPAESAILRALLIGLVFLGAAYLYFVTASVLNVMGRKEALSQITKIQSSIGGLEQQYFALSGGITPSRAKSLGLVPVGKTQYAYRPGNVGAVTMNRNAI